MTPAQVGAACGDARARPFPVVLRHPRTGRTYRLVPLDTLAPEPEVLARLVALCNEPELFRWLFAARCGDRPYGPEDARGWLAWGAAGWLAGGPCAFVALDEDGLPAAACDLQSADAEPEIGFWCGAAHRGLGTPMVEALAGLARVAGCQGLRARVRPGTRAPRPCSAAAVSPVPVPAPMVSRGGTVRWAAPRPG